MTKSEAWLIVSEYNQMDSVTESDSFLYVEALKYLIDSDDSCISINAFNLASYYFNYGYYSLALKYFEISEAAGSEAAKYEIGLIFYYGLTGIIDYEKAFNCFNKISYWNTQAKIMIALMYKNGQYVKQDYQNYKRIIEDLYENNFLSQVIARPMVFYNMGEILKDAGDAKVALKLYKKSKKELESISHYYSYYELLRQMHEITYSMYSLTEMDLAKADFFDLEYILSKPINVSFEYNNKKYDIISQMEDGIARVQFLGKWYSSPFDFLLKACIEERPLVRIYKDIRKMRFYYK